MQHIVSQLVMNYEGVGGMLCDWKKTCFVFSGVWIITDGIHCGVTKVVGEAVRDYEICRRSQQSKVVTLGFASWGEICDSERKQILKVRVSHAISCTQCHSVLR
uniref:TRPM SLOG domain-containing protein n=1 Tax=Eptatretus burgeri TaxID=7764 RepID=A0A8C4QP29_EPTBU